MLWKSPQPLKPESFEWRFAIWKRIGNYRLCFEWYQYIYTDKGDLNYAEEFRTRDGQTIHTHVGQWQPEW